MESFSRPKIPSGLWKQIEGHLEAETSYSSGDGKTERAEKLLEAVIAGVDNVE